MEVSEFEFITKEDAIEANRYVENNGISGFSGFLQRKLEEWKFVSVNIGIVGESAVGKSSFINCIRGLTADDENGAPVGTGDTTKEPTKYHHPDNEEIVFWDLPGIGTTNFPREESYLSKVNYACYDFFLLLSDERFSSNDIWLAREVDKRKKTFFFVRTKIDNSLENAALMQRHDYSEAAVLDKIKKNCEENFKVAQLKNSRIYCISNYHRDMWDFETLMNDIFVSLPDIKRNAMVLSLGPLTKGVIQSKTAMLKSRVWKAATVSALGASAASAVPVPLVGGAANVAIDFAILMHEVSFYLKQYGIDEDSLQALSDRTNTTLDYYARCLRSGLSVVSSRQTLKAVLLDAMKDQAASQIEKRFATELVRFVPLVGAVVAGGVSFGTSYYFLVKTIIDFEQDALRVIDAYIQQTSTMV